MRGRLSRVIMGFVVLGLSSVPSTARSNDPITLRIWVMTNGISKLNHIPTEQEIAAYVQNLRDDHGIIIENTIQDLLMPTDVNKTLLLANYVLDSFFIWQLTEFAAEEADHLPIAVEFIRWQDAYNRLTTALHPKQGDFSPDVVQIGSTWTADFAEKGALFEIGGWLDKDRFFTPSVASASPLAKTGLYAAPWFVDTRVIYYNKDMIPDASVFNTWDSFKTLCRNWNKQPTPLMAMSIKSEWNLMHNLAPWIWSGGGDILKVEKVGPFTTYSVMLDTPASFKAIQYLHELSETGSLEFKDLSMEELERLFLSGKYAAVISGPWALNYLGTGWQKNYGIANIPAGSGGSTAFVGGSHLALWKNPRILSSPERAIRFIQFVTGADQQYRFAVETGFLPANKDALKRYSRLIDSPAFNNALVNGHSYPSIPEWGSIIERDIIRNHIWHLWNQIASRQSPTLSLEILHEAARDIHERVRAKTTEKNIGSAVALLCGIAGLAGWLVWRARHRHIFLQRENSRFSEELRRIEGAKTVVESRLLVLRRESNQASEHLRLTQEELKVYHQKAEQLTKALEAVQRERSGFLPKTTGKFYVAWDGTLTIEGREVLFDNTLQARRLIAHLVRIALSGQSSVHCLWGYPLFGWRTSDIKSEPARLFNTAVAKMNAPLKKLGLPPLLISEGRGSQSWHLVWNPEALIQYSDIGSAESGVPTAACPRHLLEEEITRFKTGVAEMDSIAAHNPVAVTEKIKMESRLIQLEDIYRHYFGDKQPRLSLQLKTIMGALTNARRWISKKPGRHGTRSGVRWCKMKTSCV